MYSPREKVFRFAIVSRITVLLLQCIFNALIPDHDADAFKRPSNFAEETSHWDLIVYFLFNGLTHWDGEYFLHIAKEGYTYENTLAFFPCYPFFICCSADILKKIIPEFNLNRESMLIIAAVLINFACFAQAAVTLYDLTERVFSNTVIAYKAAILYCINPASIFFSAVYSESLFAYATFYTMLASVKCMPTVFVSLILSIATRSNGIVNLGFPAYFALKDSVGKQINNYQQNRNILSIWWCILKGITLKCLFILLITVILSLLQFVLVQIYNYINFCTATFNTSLPEYVLQYATENNLILAGSIHHEWCNDSLPLAYSYVQKSYWNVGFLKYYQFKQIPNFVLALPILYIMLRCITEFASEYKNELYALGLFESNERAGESEAKKYPLSTFPFMIHGLFLTWFCLLFVHIQVSTRLLASASPLLYWYCALITSHKYNDQLHLYESEQNVRSKWKVFFLSQEQYTLQDKLVLFYFIGYTIVGCFMFSNFLPWT